MCSIQDNVSDANDLDESELLGDQEDLEYTQLTEIVRNHYMNYLEKQLLENFKTCNDTESREDHSRYLRDEEAVLSIKQAAKFLESKAVAACMIAKFYQRAMVKIIAIVRRSTEENRLMTQLKKYILHSVNNEALTCDKQTQTEEAGLQINHRVKLQTGTVQSISVRKTSDSNTLDKEILEDHGMTLDEKIELFHNHLKTEHCSQTPDFRRNDRRICGSKRGKVTKRKHRIHHEVNNQQHRPYKEEDIFLSSPTNTIITPTQSIQSPKAPHIEVIATKSVEHVVAELENSNDSVAVELARLFSEEKTELDEIFGIDPNEEPDDPQICKILKEIEEAKITSKDANTTHSLSAKNKSHRSNREPSVSPADATFTALKSTDLSKSLWPCELFMQKRKLSESLARLIEEDLRWHDVITWKFFELFGDDSDDEFTPCSPSIELDEVLMGSCVKRISPWVVKHLMKPMNDGLIGNRFIFKKLAKHIARSIILENQYPDESLIKGCVENYFCVHRSVFTLNDLHTVPSLSLL